MTHSTTGARARVRALLAMICAIVLVVVVLPASSTNAVKLNPLPDSPPLADVMDNLPPAKNSEGQLQPMTVRLLRTLEQLFPYYGRNGEGVIGGYRQDPVNDHPSGQALDIMMADAGRTLASVADGHRIASFLMLNAAQLGVVYMVWRQHIWYPGREWRLMGDRNHWTHNHMDHIHVLVNGQHTPSGFLFMPGPVERPEIPSHKQASDDWLKYVGKLKTAAAKVNRDVKQAEQELAAVQNAKTSQAGSVAEAQRLVNQVARQTYMFGGDIELIASTMVMLDPRTMGMTTMVAERENVARVHAVDDAQAALTQATADVEAKKQALEAAKKAAVDANVALAVAQNPAAFLAAAHQSAQP